MVRRALVVLSLIACGCAEQATFGRLPSANPTVSVSVRDVPVKGNDVTILLTDGEHFSGELLEARSGALAVLADHAVWEVHAEDVAKIDVEIYSTTAAFAFITMWGVLGTCSVASHGFYAIFSGPVWLIASPLASVAVATDSGRRVTAGGDLASLHIYARFPQGMPPTYEARARPLTIPLR